MAVPKPVIQKKSYFDKFEVILEYPKVRNLGTLLWMTILLTC